MKERDQNSDTGESEKRSDSEGEEVYVFKDSGIRERRGRVPLWLIGVAVCLLLWGVYYLIYYWEVS